MVKDYAVSREKHLHLILLQMVIWILYSDVHRYSNCIWITSSRKNSSNKFKYDNEFFIAIKLSPKVVIKDQKSQGMVKIRFSWYIDPLITQQESAVPLAVWGFMPCEGRRWKDNSSVIWTTSYVCCFGSSLPPQFRLLIDLSTTSLLQVLWLRWILTSQTPLAFRNLSGSLRVVKFFPSWL